MPSILTSSRYKEFYRELLVNWVRKALEIARNSKANFPEVEIKRMTYGRIESTPSRGKTRGLVIAAPHGSFDWYTSELVEELSDRTSLAAVVTRGFTPTEFGGWRINVNRPTERRYPTDTVECKTDRAIEVFHDYTESVFHAARGHLDLYIEMHQNGIENHIDVATLGLTRQQAIAIKQAYQAIRDRVLRETTGVSAVNLAIEPVDTVAIGARVAKDQGTLRLAKKSLHFEFPAQLVFDRNRARRAYTRILAELIDDIVKLQGNPTAERSASFKLPNRDAK